MIDFWNRAYGIILAVLAAVAGVIGVYVTGRKAGKDSAKVDTLQAESKAKEKADAVDREYDALDNSAMRQRASRWVRSHTKR